MPPDELLVDHYLAYPDMDGSPSKVFVMTNKKDYPKHFDFAFSKRPEFELYDLSRDPDQVDNVATNPEYQKILAGMTERMMKILNDTGDPRVIGKGDAFDRMPFVDPKFVQPSKKRKTLPF